MPRSSDDDPRANLIWRSAARIAFLVMAMQRWRWDIRGAEHLPTTGGAVISSNHTSFWDFFAVGRVPWVRDRRPVRILAKESLFRTPVFGWVLARAGMIPVQRGSGVAALRNAARGLKGGELILVMPEQTVSHSFELLTFKRGPVRMAALAGVPIVPSVSWGTHRFHTAGRRPRWSWRLPVTVAFGEPLYPTRDDDLDEMLAELRRRTVVLLDDAQRDYPDGNPAGAWWVPARLGGGAPTLEESEARLQALSERWKRQAQQRRPGAANDTRPADRTDDRDR